MSRAYKRQKKQSKPKGRIAAKGGVRRFNLNHWLSTHPLSSSIVLTGVVFLLIYSFFSPVFQTNDDMFMRIRLAGICIAPEPSPYILYSNILLGYILSFFYTILPGIPWYSIYFVVCLFVAHSILTYLSFRIAPSWTTLLGIVLYWGLIGHVFLLEFQFTMIAALVSAAGYFLLLYYALGTDKYTGIKNTLRNPHVLIGILLIVLGCMIRWRSMIMITAFILVPVVILIYRRSMRRVLTLGVTGSIAILLSIGFYLVDKAVYYKDPGWKQFREFKKVRFKLVESDMFYGYSDIEQHRILSSVGWSMNDFNLLRMFFFPNDQIFSVEKISKVYEQLGSHKSKLGWDELKQRLLKVFKSGFVKYSLLFMLFGIVIQRPPPKNILAIVLTFIGIVSMLVYLIYYFRPPPLRVYYPLIAMLSLLPLLLPAQSGHEASKIGKARLYIVIGFSILLTFLSIGRIQERAKKEKNQDLYSSWISSEIQRFNTDKSELYVVWAASLPWEYFRPFDNLQPLESLNVYSLGTSQQSPASKAILKRFGIDDIAYAIATDERVKLLIVSNSVDNLLLKLNTYYWEKYRFTVSKEILYDNEVFSIVRVFRIS